MPGFQSKRAMSDSRFATLYEDPDYELDEDQDWEDEDQSEEPYSPYVTSNS